MTTNKSEVKSEQEIKIEDLYTAYRKAKVDLFFASNPPLTKLSEYEDSLHTNLSKLLKHIQSDDLSWVEDDAFTGDWTFAPKSIPSDKPSGADNEFIHSCLVQAKQEDSDKNTTAEFRLMAQCSIDFHVLSTLWMLKVGDCFDGKLSNNCYGSRLRRDKKGTVDNNLIGSFMPYFKPYRDWQDNGFEVMRSVLKKETNNEIITLTADVSSFYHELNPDFMLNETFLEKLELSKYFNNKLHQLFIAALIEWAKKTPLKKGLPVGLPASAVIANMALTELDRVIEQNITPLYYGRYVDDILMVINRTDDITNADIFWEKIFKCSDGVLNWHSDEDKSVRFNPKYLILDKDRPDPERKEGHILFGNNKNKIFVLSGDSGKDLLNSILHEINQRSSEWRSLPNLPTSCEYIGSNLLNVTSHEGKYTDNLRKLDSITLDRADFALKLRDFEAYERDLPADDWKECRHAFFKAILQYFFIPNKFFELERYFSRIIQMATACEDFYYLGQLIEQACKLVKGIEGYSLRIKAGSSSPVSSEQVEIFQKWQSELHRIIIESIISAIPSLKKSQAWDKHIKHLLQDIIDSHFFDEVFEGFSSSLQTLKKMQDGFFEKDLAYRPLRFAWLPKELFGNRIELEKPNKLKNPQHKLIGYRFNDELKKGFEQLQKWLDIKDEIPDGLIFATRTFSFNELYLIAQKPFCINNMDSFKNVIKAIRGFEISKENIPQFNIENNCLIISDSRSRDNCAIAVSSWLTENDSLTASISNRPDPNALERYQRLLKMVNHLISNPSETNYFLMPELSIPAGWFMRLAYKLKGCGISFIAGVEYIHEDEDGNKNNVCNQVWSSLIHDGLGFPTQMIYRQDKQSPAIIEQTSLKNIANKVLKSVSWELNKPPVIQHGNFHFAILICLELTNISYRASLRGKVDALFVPEWNQDIDTFNTLVESAALDIHAYIIQANNRTYGDSRIRAPYKDRWRRDVLRVKGGEHDYFVTGQIDVRALRQFQSNHISPDKPFKPVPDGFNQVMSDERKILPKG